MLHAILTALPTGSDLETLAQNMPHTFSLRILVSALLVLLVCLVIKKLLLKTLKRVLEKSKIDKSIHAIALSFAKILLIFVTILLVADALGFKITSLLAVFGVAGLAFSLALQDSLSNLASGIVILLSRPFKVGDYVTIGGFSGTVMEIGIVHTKLSTPDRQTILVPNKSITSASITNFTTEDMRRLDLVFSASYDAPTETVKQALAEAVDIDLVLKDQPVFIHLSGYGDSAIEYTVRVWVKNSSYWDAHFTVMERVRDAFEKYGVEMAYPHMDVHLIS